MTRWKWMGAGITAAVMGASFALAQEAPESLLPPGFDDPTPAPTPTPSSAPAAPSVPEAPIPPVPGQATAPIGQPFPFGRDPLRELQQFDFSSVPTIEELEEMSPDELDDLLGLSPSYDIPPAARRSMRQVGLVSAEEGGLPVGSLANQSGELVRAVLRGIDGPVVSRWGHILLRRALASRMQAPDGMNPVEFAALRAKALNNISEFHVSRALLQDVDTGNWNDDMVDAGLDAYIATTDLIGTCPVVRLRASQRDDAQWRMLGAICNSYAGEAILGGRQLDRALRNEAAPSIDVLLAQRLAGAAGRGRRAVDVEWEGVAEINPWRFALANAVGEEIPEALRTDVAPYYERVWAVTSTLPLEQRAIGADRAAREGLISAQAVTDLYSQIYANDNITGNAADTATLLREAYVGATPSERVAAMQTIWGDQDQVDYGRYVLTAFAAARVPASADLAEHAPALLASMLTAGLDRDAAAWSQVVEPGSDAWAIIALAQVGDQRIQSRATVQSFLDNDDSNSARRSAFLIAGLAGLQRITTADMSDLSSQIGATLNRESNWSRAISAAAQADNPALVAMLAGLGMQGSDWSQMTPRHLYFIVNSLRRVGLEAEARMIAAEAIARS